MSSAGTSQKGKKIETISIFERNEVPVNELLEASSPSYISYNTKIFGHTFDYVDDVATSNANVGSISVLNSTDVALGNKTYFNGPVMMKQMMMDNRQHKLDRSESVKRTETMKQTETMTQTETKETSTPKIQRLLQEHRFLICSILTAFAVILTTVVVVIYFLDIFGNGNSKAPGTPSTCEEIPSSPTHYICGYASGCSRCSAMFPANEICQSYYEPDCGDLRCFCKPQCRSIDCR